MKLCLFVTGSTGSGKTTLVRNLGLRGWTTLHTGDLYRQHNPVIPDGESKIAPESFDDKVYDYIHSILTRPQKGISLYAIEAVPRNAAQVEWISDFAMNEGVLCPILCLYAKPDIRRTRVNSRDMGNLDRHKLSMERLDEEGDVDFWSPIDIAIDEYGLSYSALDTSDNEYPPEYSPTSLMEMVNIANNFYNEVVDYGKELDGEKMMARAIEELYEAAEFDDPGKRMEELVDALWFLLLACRSTGELSVESITAAFRHKAAVNQHRLQTGNKPHGWMLK